VAARDDPGPEAHLYLTDYRSLYVAHLGDITDEDPRDDGAGHVPPFYVREAVACDCWFLLWDIQRLVADDLVSVAQELHRLRNVRYHDQPVSLYGGMVELPLIVEDPTAARYFDPRVREQVTGGRFWVEFDAERAGLGAMERELRENVLGEAAWGGLDPVARAFLATAERLFRDHQGDPGFDFAPVLVEFAKALELQANAVLRRGLRTAPAEVRCLNVGGRSRDVIADGVERAHGASVRRLHNSRGPALRRVFPRRTLRAGCDLPRGPPGRVSHPLPKLAVVTVQRGPVRTIVPMSAAVLAACVSTNAALLNPSLKLAPVCPEGVQVFTDSSKVGKPYTEVAVLNSKGDEEFTSESGLINSQRKKAAALGANGLILGQMKDPSTGAKIAKAFLGTSANRKGQAIAIYIPADTARVAAACKSRG
jgi:hypothetical protein